MPRDFFFFLLEKVKEEIHLDGEREKQAQAQARMAGPRHRFDILCVCLCAHAQVICFSQDYEKVIEFWAEYAKTEKADRLNVLSGSFSSLESSRDLMARAATIIGMEINHLYIHYPYISSSRWRAVQSIIRVGGQSTL